MKRLFILGVLVCVNLLAFAQKYYIEGYVERSVQNKTSYFTLKNVTTSGISFDKYETNAKKYDDGSLGFTFYNVTTECSKGLTKLRLEKWNEEEARWQREVESKDITPHKTDTRRTSIVLVLDFTASLGASGLETVKRSAIDFLQEMLRQTGGNGTVHIGIVAFAGKVDKYPITPLTSSSITSLQSFITKQKGVDNTYLYRAMDEAVSMLENYRPINDKQEFQGASIVTFTDGKDNGSESEDAMYFGDEYLSYVVSNRLQQKIEGKDIESYVMSIRGRDVSSSDIAKLKTLATTSTQHFKPVASFEELQSVFIEIAKSLKVTWYDLICYTPQVTGRVRWVLDCEEPKPVSVPQPTPATKPKSKADFRFIASGSFISEFYGMWAGEITATYGYNIVPKFFLGMGLGFNMDFWNENGLLPIFVEAKYDFIKNKRVSPFVRGRLGYSFIDNSSAAPYWDFVVGASFYNKSRSFGYSIFIGMEGAQIISGRFRCDGGYYSYYYSYTCVHGYYSAHYYLTDYYYYNYLPCLKVGMAFEFGRAQ